MCFKCVRVVLLVESSSAIVESSRPCLTFKSIAHLLHVCILIFQRSNKFQRAFLPFPHPSTLILGGMVGGGIGWEAHRSALGSPLGCPLWAAVSHFPHAQLAVSQFFTIRRLSTNEINLACAAYLLRVWILIIQSHKSNTLQRARYNTGTVWIIEALFG